MKKIVMIGDSPEAGGGVASVIRTYRDSGFFEQLNICYLSSFERPGLILQCWVMARTVSRLLWMLVTNQVALLQVHCSVRGSFWRKSFLCALARIFSVPYIFHLHSGKFPTFIREDCNSLGRWWAGYTLRKAQFVIALTSGWHAAMDELIPGLNLLVLGNPVKVAAELPERRVRTFNVLFLGRLCETKGVTDLVSAIPLVLKSVPEAIFTLAGNGEFDGINGLINSLDIQNKVKLPGWVDGEIKRNILASTNVLVLPSYFEGLPISILEAMANGIPVVATNVGGIPELLENGKCGLLINPGNKEELAAAIVNLLKDQELAEHIRQQAFLRVKELYSVQAVLNALGDIYCKSGVWAKKNRKIKIPVYIFYLFLTGLSLYCYAGSEGKDFVAKPPYLVRNGGISQEIALEGKLRRFDFGGSMPFVNPETGVSDMATINVWDSFHHKAMVLTSDQIQAAGVPKRVYKISDYTAIGYLAGDGPVEGKLRTQVNSYPITSGKHFVWDLSFRLGGANLNDPWFFTAQGIAPATLWQLKSPGLPPALVMAVDTDPSDRNKLALNFDSRLDPDKPASRLVDVGGLASNHDMDVRIEAFLDDRSMQQGGNGFLKITVNNQLIFERNMPVTQQTASAPYQWSLAMYLYSNIKPLNFSRFGFWKRARLLAND